ncbi:hypothetical protein FEAC_10860 [Ferrimicrobium acidiphilum DSM 19497]|uniref:Uncharacterized protein n=1 Tax=Ferrimicrobium acidiphilum DSM 19497 TaxID=1121877 RepID=A0A0D8FVK7_9ACTN|nr:hypothetical protein FEAC_10860 [Ferrimicrobium acidiphilum DSM 19497]
MAAVAAAADCPEHRAATEPQSCRRLDRSFGSVLAEPRGKWSLNFSTTSDFSKITIDQLFTLLSPRVDFGLIAGPANPRWIYEELVIASHSHDCPRGPDSRLRVADDFCPQVIWQQGGHHTPKEGEGPYDPIDKALLGLSPLSLGIVVAKVGKSSDKDGCHEGYRFGDWIIDGYAHARVVEVTHLALSQPGFGAHLL